MGKLRVGRDNDRIVYHQLGDEPRDNDQIVAVFFDERDAQYIVDLYNGQL